MENDEIVRGAWAALKEGADELSNEHPPVSFTDSMPTRVDAGTRYRRALASGSFGITIICMAAAMMSLNSVTTLPIVCGLAFAAFLASQASQLIPRLPGLRELGALLLGLWAAGLTEFATLLPEIVFAPAAWPRSQMFESLIYASAARAQGLFSVAHGVTFLVIWAIASGLGFALRRNWFWLDLPRSTSTGRLMAVVLLFLVPGVTVLGLQLNSRWEPEHLAWFEEVQTSPPGLSDSIAKDSPWLNLSEAGRTDASLLALLRSDPPELPIEEEMAGQYLSRHSRSVEVKRAYWAYLLEKPELIDFHGLQFLEGWGMRRFTKKPKGLEELANWEAQLAELRKTIGTSTKRMDACVLGTIRHSRYHRVIPAELDLANSQTVEVRPGPIGWFSRLAKRRADKAYLSYWLQWRRTLQDLPQEKERLAAIAARRKDYSNKEFRVSLLRNLAARSGLPDLNKYLDTAEAVLELQRQRLENGSWSQMGVTSNGTNYEAKYEGYWFSTPNGGWSVKQW